MVVELLFLSWFDNDDGMPSSSLPTICAHTAGSISGKSARLVRERDHRARAGTAWISNRVRNVLQRYNRTSCHFGGLKPHWRARSHQPIHRRGYFFSHVLLLIWVGYDGRWGHSVVNIVHVSPFGAKVGQTTMTTTAATTAITQ